MTIVFDKSQYVWQRSIRTMPNL